MAMRWGAFCGAMLGLLGGWAAGAHAQSLTDNELYAAYCKGVTDQQLADGGGWLLGQIQKENQRFTAYLLSTGVLTDTRRDPLGLALAVNRGKADQAQCVAGVNACTQRVVDQQRQNRISQKQANDMLGACATSPECARANRCGGADSLPF